MTITNIVLNAYAEKVFGAFLKDSEITEIAVNRPGEIWTEKCGVWVKHINENIDLKTLKYFSVAFAGFNNTGISDINPIVSGTLETGERVQVVYPTATEKGTISITLRKPSDNVFSHQSYVERGFYKNLESKRSGLVNHEYNDELISLYRANKFDLFLEQAVRLGKTIVFAGETGSGKTSFMKTLIEYIPLDSRIITIEDTAEVKFYKHQNYVHLYYCSEATTNHDAIVTSASLLTSCLRMKPNRIILSEIRGAEAWDFLKVVSSGHSGSMTSMHAGTIEEAITGIALRCLQNPEGRHVSSQTLKDMVREKVDIICIFTAQNGARYIDDIYFKDVDYQQNNNSKVA